MRAAIRRIQVNEVSALQLSFGAATARDDESLASVIGRADAAMYAAKKRRVPADTPAALGDVIGYATATIAAAARNCATTPPA